MFHVSLVGRKALSVEIYRQMRDGVLTGRLRPGDRLPASRELARTLGVSRGVVVSADDVTVTNGTQQALDILARVLLAAGDRVAVEDRGYAPPRRLFEALGRASRGRAGRSRGRDRESDSASGSTDLRNAFASVPARCVDDIVAAAGAAGVGGPTQCRDHRRRLR